MTFLNLDCNKSFYKLIEDSIVDGALPKDFSLPVEDENEKLRFMDGAKDGISIYHTAMKKLDETAIKDIEHIMKALVDGEELEAYDSLLAFSKEHTAICAIDDFEGYIIENRNWIDPNKAHRFALNLIFDANREIIKYGLEILELFGEPNDKVKKVIRTLALSDEFTIFALFNIRNWENANEELFALAQKVRGWGRIHLIDKLEANTEEIRAWLLAEGVDNDVLPAYSALTVYELIDAGEMVKGKLTDEEVVHFAKLIDALLDEGPCAGISAIEDAPEMLATFLAQVKKHDLKDEIQNILNHIKNDYEDANVVALCDELLN